MTKEAKGVKETVPSPLQKFYNRTSGRINPRLEIIISHTAYLWLASGSLFHTSWSLIVYAP